MHRTQVNELVTQSNTHQRHSADMHLLFLVQSYQNNALAIDISRRIEESNVASEKENRRLKVGKSTGAKEKGKPIGNPRGTSIVQIAPID